MDTIVRNLDEHAYRAIRVRAEMEGRTVDDLINEAIRTYLARAEVRQRKSTLRLLKPVHFPEGNEHLSSDIDALVYGEIR